MNDIEKNLLISRYRRMLVLSRPNLQKGDTVPIRKAFNLALEASENGKTALDEPRIFYAIDLTEILSVEMGLGKNSITCAILSDAYVHQKISDNQITRDFDPIVLKVLSGIKKITLLDTGKTSFHSENFIKLFMSIAGDIRVILIKIADSLYHLRIIDRLPGHLQESVAREAYYLYAPIAHRLGLYHIKTELEDLSMKAMHKEDYQLISNKLKETHKALNDYIRKFQTPIEKTLKTNGFVFELKGRPKSVHSIWTKMQKQQVPFEEVFDILAIRVILKETIENEKADCWKVYSLITDIYPPNPARLRDWVSAPKSSGYESLHTTVQGPQGKWVEVQIRTARMDEIAEKGPAAHWLYKKGGAVVDAPIDRIKKMRNLMENPDIHLLDQDENNRLDAATDYIYVFTPQGDLKQITRGATVLDFAFEVHTGLGYKCTGAKIQGKNVTIKHVLQNGDEVEILTSKNQKPKSDWLTFVKSSRTRQKIKRALKEDELKEAEAGRDTLIRKFKNWKINFNDENIDKVIKTLKYKTPMDMYHAIALEKLDVAKVKEVFQPAEKQEIPVVTEISDKSVRKPETSKEDFVLLDQNLAGINYVLASCCNPIFGDEVFGFVTISKGISVHRVNCPNAQDLKAKFDYRVIQVKWREASSTGSFQATVRINGIDSLGIVSTISDVISKDLKVNMRSISVDSNNGVFEGTIKLYVSDTKHLDMLLHRLMKIKGILKATRLD